jgi:hypothetical protein
MRTPREPDALLIGGPRNDTSFIANEAAMVELEIDGLVHRYIGTDRRRDHDGRSLVVYTYDGVIRPTDDEPR